MDEAKYDEAVVLAYVYRTIIEYVLQDPARSLANLARREFDSSDTVIQAWKREAENRDRRSKLAKEALKLIDPGMNVQLATRQGPHPECNAVRNYAALGAMWYLSECQGFEPQTRNRTQKKSAVPGACASGGSVCDAVGEKMGLTYKSAELVWTNRAKTFRDHQLFTQVLWAELPSVSFLGVPFKKLLGRNT